MQKVKSLTKKLLSKKIVSNNNKFKYFWDSIKKAYKIKIEKAEKSYIRWKKWDIKYKAKIRSFFKTSN